MKTYALAAAAIASAAIAIASPAAPASAQVAIQEPIAVSVADLDLSTARGRATLDLRLLRAARTACGTPSPADPHGQATLEACVSEARAAADAQIESAIALARRQAPPVLATR